MTEEMPPLAAIQDTERAMARRLEDARTEADEQVRSARQASRRRIAEAMERGRWMADEHYQATVTAAEQDAEQIGREGETAAAELEARFEGRLSAAVEAMVEFILPKEG